MNRHCPSAIVSLALTALRMAIGWHLLYEGLIKVTARQWTSAGFLADSTWVLADVFRYLADSPAILRTVDLLNMYGLTLAGLALVLGVLTRTSAILAAVLLSLYYVADPPFVGLRGMVGEGNYLIINKNLVEALALVTVALVPGNWMYGLDRLRQPGRRASAAREEPAPTPPEVAAFVAAGGCTERRQVLRHFLGLPVLAGFAWAFWRKRQWDSLEEKYLLQAADGVSSATLKQFDFAKLKDLQGTMTYRQIGGLTVSRLILGGNLIGGWAHSRDLLYTSDLVKAYHDDRRIIATFRLAEKCGINTLITHPKLLRIIRKYWKLHDGRIQYVADCGGQDLQAMVRLAIEGGAHAGYVQGATGDRLIQEGKLDEIRRALDVIRSRGLPAGIGAHRIETIQACIAADLRPDFWMKTLHHHNYRSAIENVHKQDNFVYSIFCPDPQETLEVMRQVTQPWIAFKVLAAGAIAPEDGFSYAFKNGADFICAGMYDFQIVDDVNIANRILANLS